MICVEGSIEKFWTTRKQTTLVKMLNWLHEFIFEGDVQEKTLIKYPSLSLTIVTAYVLFVKWIGPAIMKNRKPFNLQYILIVYDAGQVIVNAYLTYTIYCLTVDGWPHRCMLKKSSVLPLYMQRIMKVGWQIYLIKYMDLIDTVFFVLRKKDYQISFLHVFHHAFMCALVSWGLKNAHLGSMGLYLGFAFAINTTVHVIVYLYYGITALGPHMNKYLWWKKYLTVFQMCQFAAIQGYMVHGFITGCEEFGLMEVCVFLYVTAIFLMFIDFYQKYKEE
ncbi:hypothetical protein JTE90_026856 [Oedothorax gibbosus]|uniref:Elongation of very long chain fatty acids protein n=1 Tax=Oedothorax gibbosus TaxID=931172 RepID=A0AAV6U0G4_9ARAC|nr:hypothetical protein JTE90_026856 [Oedothorax gibbosus]